MFGLTRREQRWKAEQKAAETVVGLVAAVVRAAADVRIAEANEAVAKELAQLRKENEQLRAAQKKENE